MYIFSKFNIIFCFYILHNMSYYLFILGIYTILYIIYNLKKSLKISRSCLNFFHSLSLFNTLIIKNVKWMLKIVVDHV